MTFRLSHLALLLAVTIVVTAIGGVTATYRIADEEFRDVLDEDLEIQSEFLAEFFADRKRLPSGSDLQELLEDAFEPDEDEDTRWVSVYDTRSGLRVSNLPHDFALESTDDRAVERQFDGYTWRGYQSEEDDIVVQILRREDLFDEVRKDILEHIVTPAVTGGVINLLLLGILISFFTWPLTRLVRQLETRSADSLAPIEMRTPAREVIVLRDALNRMMSGVDAVLQRERGFANDVAHELRTPLSTLLLQAQSLRLGGTDETKLTRASGIIERAARSQAQLIDELLERAEVRQKVLYKSIGRASGDLVRRTHLLDHAAG